MGRESKRRKWRESCELGESSTAKQYMGMMSILLLVRYAGLVRSYSW